MFFNISEKLSKAIDKTLEKFEAMTAEEVVSIGLEYSKEEYDILNSCDPEIFIADEWEQAVQKGWYNEDDGSGFWGTPTHYNYEHSAFHSRPHNATHVHWFSK